MTPIDIRIELLRRGIRQNIIARKYKVSQPMVSFALNGKRTGKKAQSIRNYAINLIQRKAV